MSVYNQDDTAKADRIFISYSSIDRIRTNGLALLLEAMGHQIFHDHRTIKPGRRWKAALQDGLDDADAVMVFWTKHAARSDWVRKEYEYFAAQYPDRLLIPVVGDETPLTELLKTRQQADFVPVVNEVLDMKRRMKKEGAGTDQIEQAVRERLGGEGVELKGKHHKRLLFLFLGFGWLLTLLRYPGAWFRKAGNASVEKAAQATAGQLAAVALAAVIGSGIAIPVVERGIPRDIAELQQEIGSLQDKNRELERSNEELLAMDGSLAAMRGAIDGLGNKIDDLAADGESRPVSCVSPQDFAACQDRIAETRNSLDARLTDIAALLNRRGAVEGPQVVEPQVVIEDLDPVTTSDQCEAGFEPLSKVEPDYPDAAKSEQIEGDVIVRATINAEGEVTDVEVESGANELLNEAARAAMFEWTFSACTVEGGPTSAMHRVRFKFYIRD